jgi:hypothetical protein
MNQFLSPSRYQFPPYCYCVDKNGLIWQQQKESEFKVPRCQCYAFVTGTTDTRNNNPLKIDLKELKAEYATGIPQRWKELQGTLKAEVSACAYCSPAGSNLNFEFSCIDCPHSFTFQGTSAEELKCDFTKLGNTFTLRGYGLFNFNPNNVGFAFTMKDIIVTRETKVRYYGLVVGDYDRFEFKAYPPTDESNTFAFGRCEGA